MTTWDQWRRRLRIIAAVVFFIATIVSIIGGPWNTYGNHTAITGFAETSFIVSFIKSKGDRRV